MGVRMAEKSHSLAPPSRQSLYPSTITSMSSRTGRLCKRLCEPKERSIVFGSNYELLQQATCLQRHVSDELTCRYAAHRGFFQLHQALPKKCGQIVFLCTCADAYQSYCCVESVILPLMFNPESEVLARFKHFKKNESVLHVLTPSQLQLLTRKRIKKRSTRKRENWAEWKADSRHVFTRPEQPARETAAEIGRGAKVRCVWMIKLRRQLARGPKWPLLHAAESSFATARSQSCWRQTYAARTCWPRFPAGDTPSTVLAKDGALHERKGWNFLNLSQFLWFFLGKLKFSQFF